jgi:hypothetical protein
MQGQGEEGITQVHQGLAAWRASGVALRGYPERLSLHRRKLRQHPCGNEIQGDRKEQVGSA